MNNNNNSSSGGISDQSIVMLVMALVLGACAKYINNLQAWAEQHWFFLSVSLAAIVYGVVQYARWKFRMKHPEVYERQLAIKQMQNRNNRGKHEF